MDTKEKQEEAKICLQLAEDDIIGYMRDNDIESVDDVDIINYLNDSALEANAHDVLLATGGPAYGISLIHGTPCAWAQGWFSDKTVRQIQDDEVFKFWVRAFDELEELMEKIANK